MKIWHFGKKDFFTMEKVNKRFWGDDEEKQTQTTTQTMTPVEYPQSEAARGDWYQSLQEWGADPMYGAITPNFQDIYSKAAKRVNQYYWGGASGQPGLVDKIRSRGAARGVQDSPAVDVLTQRAGAEEAQQLGELSTSVDTLKASAGEAARNNWMTSLMNLARMKSGAYTSTGTQVASQPGTDVWDVLGTVGSGIGQGVGNYFGSGGSGGFMKQFQDLMNPQKTQGSLTPSQQDDVMYEEPEWKKYASLASAAGKMNPQTAPFAYAYDIGSSFF